MPFQFDKDEALDQQAKEYFQGQREQKLIDWEGMSTAQIIDDLINSAHGLISGNLFRVLLNVPGVIGITPAKARRLVKQDTDRIDLVHNDGGDDNYDRTLKVMEKYEFNRHAGIQTKFKIKTDVLYSHLIWLSQPEQGYQDLYIKFGESSVRAGIGNKHIEKLNIYFGGIKPHSTKSDNYLDADAGFNSFIKDGTQTPTKRVPGGIVINESKNFKKRNHDIHDNKNNSNYSRHPNFGECNWLGGIIHNLKLSIKYIEDNFNKDDPLEFIYLIPAYDDCPQYVDNVRNCNSPGISTLIFAKYPKVRNENGEVSTSFIGYDYGDAGTGCCP